MLGDYWFGHSEHIPSSVLVDLLGEFGSTTASSRAALSRLARRGLLRSSKQGRNTYYGLTERAAGVLDEGIRRIVSFGATPRQWDGKWRCIAFSVPEDERHNRHSLRARLRWLGFAPLYDGLWVSPHDVTDAALAILDELELESATVLVAEAAPRGNGVGDPIAAWDLDALRETYDDFLAAYLPAVDRIRSHDIDPVEALVLRTEVMDDWRNMPNIDPELPPELLPDDWPRDRACATFVEIYDSLGPLAEARVREMLSEAAPELAHLAAHHPTSTVLDTPDTRDG